jgi:hypothetical protein
MKKDDLVALVIKLQDAGARLPKAGSSKAGGSVPSMSAEKVAERANVIDFVANALQRLTCFATLGAARTPCEKRLETVQMETKRKDR